MKSDHKAIIADCGQPLQNFGKQRVRRAFRKCSPAQHADSIHHIAQLKIEVDSTSDVQANFDAMYEQMYRLLEQFYPLRQITVTSTDPHFVTPAIKAMLRRKNRLSRAGRTEKADALAKQIRTAITRKESAWLRKVNTRQNPKTAWAKVRQITKRDARDSFTVIDGLTSQTLNDHYAAISTDSQYSAESHCS